ncbi:tumor necrosis factor receptor superfamily member 5-like [Hippocampus zosterae]|uniref:tumor necrosis factor receptor superfamily member 5-like n=1 Tax=Hippocampus zosterae TaxID=109293 RepID=UPI00223E0AD2|nr:tumor necrosis factor receptor superfamily member 5-like [Hippocampus zosterae]
MHYTLGFPTSSSSIAQLGNDLQAVLGALSSYEQFPVNSRQLGLQVPGSLRLSESLWHPVGGYSTATSSITAAERHRRQFSQLTTAHRPLCCMAVLVAPLHLHLPLLLLPLLLLPVGGSLSRLEHISRGCKKWSHSTSRSHEVCCDECHPGNRLVWNCGAIPDTLCTPCENGTYTQKPKDYKCSRCTQCEGAQVLVKKCTAATDTQCGCKEGLMCGDERCSFCRKKCGKGEEPTEKRSCRTCPNGTFNDQMHQKCKPWSIKCAKPHEMIAARADAFTDIKCINVSRSTLKRAESNGSDFVWPLVWSVLPSVCLLALSIALIVAVFCRMRRKKEKVQITIPPLESAGMVLNCMKVDSK